MANKMILNKLKIRGLYGLYDYDLDFAGIKAPDVRFITAPNGFGKTTILRLIEAFFNRKMTMFVNPKLRYKEIEFYLPQYMVRVSQNRIVNDDIDSDDIMDDVKATISVFTVKGVNLKEEKIISREEAEQEKNDLLPKSLNIYLSSKRSHLVADNRLWVSDSNHEHVVELSRKIKDLICERDKQIETEVNKLIFHYANGLPVADTELKKARIRVGKLLARYHAVGIAKEFDDNLFKQGNNPLSIPYLLALNETLSADDTHLKKLEQFARWVKQCVFVNKKLVLQKESGVVFEVNDGIRTKILPEELSSGEKHMVVQAAELLFDSQDVSIVLIDEPELSYHPAWQMIYLQNIRRISKLSRIQYIIATHNAQMFDYDWDLSIDLFTQYKQLHK